MNDVFDTGEQYFEESVNQMLGNLDFTEMESFLAGTDTSIRIRFTELLQILLTQEGQVDKQWFLSQIWTIIASELQESRPIFVQILILCVAFAMLNNFASVFKNSHIHKTCFYIYYLALITLLMKAYLISSQLLISVLDQLVLFMEALIPAFTMALAFSSALSTATVFYQIVLVVIYLTERILVYFLVPAVHIYVVLAMLNLLTEENMISEITKLLKKGITWCLRIMVAAVTGINLLQNMIAPALDGLKHTAITKAVSVIPGLGSAANAVTSMYLGSAIVIKNGIGVAAIVILCLLTMVPLMKLATLTLLYKLTGALMQPVAQKEVCSCISGVGDGVKILLQILITGLMMFMISIAMVTASVRM